MGSLCESRRAFRHARPHPSRHAFLMLRVNIKGTVQSCFGPLQFHVIDHMVVRYTFLLLS